jgi:hypothetical protein
MCGQERCGRRERQGNVTGSRRKMSMRVCYNAKDIGRRGRRGHKGSVSSKKRRIGKRRERNGRERRSAERDKPGQVSCRRRRGTPRVGSSPVVVVSKKRRARRWEVGKRESPYKSNQSHGRKGQRFRVLQHRGKSTVREAGNHGRKGVGKREREKKEVWWLMAGTGKEEGAVSDAVGKARTRRSVCKEGENAASLCSAEAMKSVERGKIRGRRKRRGRARGG